MKDKLFDLFFNNLKNPKMYGFILVLFTLFFMLFPYLDANLFYYKRINDRVDVLSKVSTLDEDSIQNNPALQKEYNNILLELSNQPENLVINIFTKETNSVMNTAKFISGGLLAWLFATYFMFSKKAGAAWQRVLAVIILVIFGVILGFVAESILNIFNPFVNCVGMPILQITLAALFFTSNKNKANADLNKSTDR